MICCYQELPRKPYNFLHENLSTINFCQICRTGGSHAIAPSGNVSISLGWLASGTISLPFSPLEHIIDHYRNVPHKSSGLNPLCQHVNSILRTLPGATFCHSIHILGETICRDYVCVPFFCFKYQRVEKLISKSPTDYIISYV